MADNLPLGQLIDSTQQRDAVHIAVAPVVAAHILMPGEHVGFIGDDYETVGRVEARIGIVDPFLRAAVMPGRRFWLFLYPGSITSLRHDWTHPAFFGAATTSAEKSSRDWLRGLASEFEVSYDELLTAIRSRSHCFSNDMPDGYYERHDDMCRHYAIVTGEHVDPKMVLFRCAC